MVRLMRRAKMMRLFSPWVVGAELWFAEWKIQRRPQISPGQKPLAARRQELTDERQTTRAAVTAVMASSQRVVNLAAGG